MINYALLEVGHWTLDRSNGHEFYSRPGRYQVTSLAKLFTPMCLCHQVLSRGILKILNLSEILPVYLVDRLYLSVVVTYRRQILHIWSVSAVVEN